ncbi:helix-turn-helix domain-containing protein [Vibrio gallicus]|uniref:helix-turn-helix domain-containing protein n=1 Tax=Vibrio gallicus TaxID=190897 RepID=UPI0021C28EE5|nr:helix-turn-helix transcriptional regulator [Vibrio gallicus]
MPQKTKHIPVIQTQYARIFVELFAKHGFDLHQLLRDSELPADLMQQNSDFVPAQSLKRLIYLVSAQLGVTNLADLLTLAFRHNIIPKLVGRLNEYDTVGDVLKEADTIFSADSPGSTVYCDDEHGQLWFSRKTNIDADQPFQWNELFSILYIQEFISALTNQQWHANKVRLQGSEYDIVKSVLDDQCQIFISQDSTAVYIPPEIASHPLSLHQTSPQPITWHTSFTDSVFEALHPYCNEQSLNINEAAGILGFSVRTLQRKLKEEHTSFRKLKESIILSIACDLMEQDKSLTFISRQLGYQNISHFSRAFKRISGLTPKLYKKSLLNIDSLP